ncbi:TonB-dependent receptor [Tamlana sp. 2_MG-2023]|uniref:TonB-dependent receptor n=1 Tax=unclassified Tamlana TaxID=2614803 RepID=UPI0026E243ED|nr:MULTISPECIES: TonB-dependent receptor plug domain-containing protein [unclassified Tamlana]MDO6761110.1 TonB-dependent receptor [Tamlana sp. 2_MG-2023]MDO6791557.1 TonB-dependent receptor [Tamlana sp. 1_MG-2023]
MKTYLTSIFLLLFSLFGYSQNGHLYGEIAFNNDEPVLGAQVVLRGGSIERITSSGIDGEFAFKNLPYGTYTIETHSLEAKPHTIEAEINAVEQTLKYVLEITEFQDLEEVHLRTKTKKEKIEEGGFAVAIIDTKEASLRNLTTNELLDRSVGVRIRQNGGIGSNVEYNLNGMSGSTIGIFIDGLELSTYGQSFNLNNIPTSMIERIEVYKGVLPSHLTGDYAGGAINVVLKKDVSQNNINLATSYGSFNTFQSDVGVTLREKKTGLSFRGAAFYIYTDNSYETWGRSTTYVNHLGQITRPYRAKRFNNTYKSIGGRFEAGFTDTKWADQFFIGYNGSSNYKEIPHGVTMAVPYVGRFNETAAKVILLNYSKKDFLTENLALNINGAQSYRNTFLQDTVGIAYNWDGTMREVIEYGERVPLKTLQGGQQGEKTMLDIDRRITNIRSNLGYMVAHRHRVSLNHKYEGTKRTDEDLLNAINQDLATKSIISQNIVSLNYEAETFNRKLKTNLLGKYISNRTKQTKSDIVVINEENTVVTKDTLTTNSNFGYGGTLSFNAFTDFYLIASAENSFIAPSENQLFGAPEINILPNTNLNPEQNINYNLGFRFGTLEIDKHKFSVYANAFWRNGYDKITQQVVDESEIEEEADADIQTTRYVNLGKTQARGYEAELIYIYNNRLNTSFNFSKFNNVFKQELDENGDEHSLLGQQVPNEPFFTINANIQYRFDNLFQKKSILNTYYTIGYVGEYYTVWGQPEWSKTPSQLTHDLGVSYHFPSQNLIASIDVKNLFNAEVYDNFAIQKPGRGIYFKLNYIINNFL